MDYCQQVIETLAIDIAQLKRSLQLDEEDCRIVCQFLLGHTRREVAVEAVAQLHAVSKADHRLESSALEVGAAHQPAHRDGLAAKPAAETARLKAQIAGAERRIRDRLSARIYPALAKLMGLPQQAVAGKWVRILNYLYHPSNGYRLSPPPQLNQDSFQGSFGRQMLLPPPSQTVAQLQMAATRFYQRGLYYQALHAFTAAWNQEQADYGRGNPEVLIYINNCLVALFEAALSTQSIDNYAVAVVVPVHHNQGQVAAEVLRGVAQRQWTQNLRWLRHLRLDRDLDWDALPCSDVETPATLDRPYALRVMIVNDANRLYDVDNATAEALVALAPQLNLMAVIGHYSSEMTEKAVAIYARHGLPLVNASSTSDDLSQLSPTLQPGFFRLTTPDRVNATALMQYLSQHGQATSPRPVALIYNPNSRYCQSYQRVVRQYIDEHPETFVLAGVCDLGESYERLQPALAQATESADIVIVVPDGGIEPNSLNNAGLISRLSGPRKILAGSATLYQNNVLHWMHERYGNKPERSPVIACIPWHWHSATNGCKGNAVGQQFCQLGRALWGTEQSWRSATAFDAGLVIDKILGRHRCPTGEALLIQMHRYFKLQPHTVNGVTGPIRFDAQGDRHHPPTEIVTVRPDAQQRWMWDIAPP